METSEEEIIQQVCTVLDADTRIKASLSSLRLAWKDGLLTMAGEVGSIAEKRLAVQLACEVDGIRKVDDQLCVALDGPQGDGEILDTYARFLLQQIDLRNCTIRQRAKGRQEYLRESPGDDYDSSGEIEISVSDGVILLEGHVISLSHRRVAEVLAWWVPGCRNVIDRLEVVPPEEDGDDELSDAVHLSLEMDPLVHAHADQISISTRGGVVTLEGGVGREEERQMAESGAWYVSGVRNVVNRLAVVQ